MKVEKFEDLFFWQRAKELTLSVYSIFKDNKDFRFRDQIQAASISIMNNIAEGFERRSNKEFSYFLNVAKGSSAEVRSMLYIAKELDYISEQQFDDLYNKIVEISKLIFSFNKTLN